MSKLFFMIFFCFAFFAQAESDGAYQKGPSGEWPLRFDTHASAFMGSSILSSINNAFFWSEDRLLEKSGISLAQPYSGILRVLELGLVVLPISDFLFLWQHEFFGHGARAREFGFKVSWPKFSSLPLPYGAGLGAVRYEGNANKLQSLLVAIGGVEGANIMAEEMSMNWWKHKKINAKSAWMHILASHNIDGYLWLFSPKFFDIPGHDMVYYIDKVNGMYGDKRLDLDYMTWGVATNLLDPFLYLSFYSMYKYVINGKTDQAMPVFRFGENVSYLPAMRYVLSPFGPEFHLINYLTIYEQNIKAYARYGSLKDSRFYGIGAMGEVYKFKSIDFGAEAHLWRQPQMLASSFGDQQFGGYGAISVSARPLDFLTLTTQVGYKSSGYVLGEPIDAGFIWRAGLIWHL